jgi:hypothetical protein
MIDEVTPTIQQNDHRSFLPALRAAVEPAINDVVLREGARSRRGKAEVQSRLVGVELNPRRLAFGGNEVRTFQKLECFLQPGISSIGGRQHHGHELNGPPVKILGYRRDHAMVI